MYCAVNGNIIVKPPIQKVTLVIMEASLTSAWETLESQSNKGTAHVYCVHAQQHAEISSQQKGG